MSLDESIGQERGTIGRLERSSRPRDVAVSVPDDTATDPDSPRAILAGIFQRPSADAHVAIVHGYGAQIRVQHGQLVIRDGIGRHRRERSYPKTDRTLRRIIVTAVYGFVSLESYRWLAEHDITVTMLNPDGELSTFWTHGQSAQDARLIRRQALAVTDGIATDIARELLTRKVRGQADTLLKHTGDTATTAKLYNFAGRMADAEDITQTKHQVSVIASLSELEGWSARDYFAAWQAHVRIRWDPKSEPKIPEHCRGYPGRLSLIAGGATKQLATLSANDMLNYAYTVAESEARTACIAHGLDPRLGFIHADKPGPDSPALDILEALPPDKNPFF